MKPLFITYPKCSTCVAAKKFLVTNDVDFDTRDIMTETPTKAELKTWIERSNMPVKKFFNSTGNMYKEMNLKDTINSLNDDQMIELLSSSGWLIKRPLLITDDSILVGFHEELYESIL